MARCLAVLALLLFAVGLLAGTAPPARAGGHHGHAAHHEQAMPDADAVVVTSAAEHPAHPGHLNHADGSCCTVGTCGAVGLPELHALGAPAPSRSGPPSGQRIPALLNLPPPLPPPRA